MSSSLEGSGGVRKRSYSSSHLSSPHPLPCAMPQPAKRVTTALDQSAAGGSLLASGGPFLSALHRLADALETQGQALLAQAEGLRELAAQPDETRLNLKQAAAELGVSAGFVKAAIGRGELPAERLGKRCWRVSRAAVERLRRMRAA